MFNVELSLDFNIQHPTFNIRISLAENAHHGIHRLRPIFTTMSNSGFATG
jgi:hypothetical protein